MTVATSTNLLNDPTRPVGLEGILAPDYAPGSNVLHVGANEQFTSLSAAVAASHDGDVILVDAGTYTNDFVQTWNKLTIIGVGGMVNMVATVPPPNQKAILTVDADLTLQNFSFSGAAIATELGGNAAGIRWENGAMTLANDSFTGNQNGILAGPGLDNTAAHTITIDHSYFDNNGSGSGNTHNIYIGAIDNLTVTNSIFAEANVGHEFKSRAMANTISNNLFYDGPTGTASYDIDLPDGGVDTVTNNVIEKGPFAQNNAMVHFGGEGLPYADSSLNIQGNTFVNDKGAGTLGVLNQSGLPITIQGNTFDNLAAGAIAYGPATITGNVDQSGQALANSSSTDPVPGSTLTFTDANPHAVTLDGSVPAVRGGAGLLTVYAIAGHIAAISGSGGMNYTDGPNSGGNQLTTIAGSTNTLTLVGQDVVSSSGNDTINTGALNVTGQINATATVNLGTAYDTWVVAAGAQATFNGGGGGPFLTMMSGSTTRITGSLNNMHMQDIGGTVSVDVTLTPAPSTGSHLAFSITGGSTQTILWAGSTSISTATGSQGATISLGDGNIQVTSNGADTISVGAGNDTIILSGNSTVYAGTGTLSVFGRGIQKGHESKVYGNGGTYTIDGDTGNIIYYGGDKASTVQAILSNITLNGGAGHMTINGGLSETINGGAGGITYNSQGGSATISTAAGSTNTLLLGVVGNTDSWGTDTITGGSGNDTITAHGNATITGGTGNRTITLMGNDTLSDLGNDRVTVTRGANVTINTGASVGVQECGATVRIAVGGSKPASATVIGGSASIGASQSGGLSITTNAGYSTNLNLGAGSVTVQTAGADLIHGSVGSASIGIASNNVQIWGGSGSMTINQLSSLATNMKFYGGTGTANLTVWNGGADVIFGSGSTTVQSSVGGGAANTYEAIAGRGGGTDVITGFRAGIDRLLLEGVGVKSQSVAAGSASLVLTDNTHLQLVGVTNLQAVLG